MSHPSDYAQTDVLLAPLAKNRFELRRLRLSGKDETLRADKVFLSHTHEIHENFAVRLVWLSRVAMGVCGISQVGTGSGGKEAAGERQLLRCHRAR